MLFSYQNKDIINFAGTWVEIENIILSEIPQTKGHAKYVVTERDIFFFFQFSETGFLCVALAVLELAL